tara:strand:+ start:64675 stop:65187 length:513 start_codon:yes stop_codon:yes gene_type:complete
MKREKTSILITDFTNFASQKWKTVNDQVMGGESYSHLQIQSNGNGVFIGEISLENGGGFASVKNQSPLNLDGFENIHIKAKGDGNQYSFRFRTGNAMQKHHWSYEFKFQTEAGIWQNIRLPLSEFKAVYRGNLVENVPRADLSAIKEYGFLIGDRQNGHFRLEIDHIEAD